MKIQITDEGQARKDPQEHEKQAIKDLEKHERQVIENIGADDPGIGIANVADKVYNTTDEICGDLNNHDWRW